MSYRQYDAHTLRGARPIGMNGQLSALQGFLSAHRTQILHNKVGQAHHIMRREGNAISCVQERVDGNELQVIDRLTIIRVDD